MSAVYVGCFLAAGALLVPGGGARALQTTPFHPGTGATRTYSSGASSTVLATLVSRGERLVVLVLWRGSPGWLGRGGRVSSRGGSGMSETWAQLTRGGDVTLSLDIDHATGLARILNKQIPVGNQNVFLVDGADSPAPIVRTARVQPMVPDTPDAPSVLLKRDPALVAFLQCDLMRADPFFERRLAEHPCGG